MPIEARTRLNLIEARNAPQLGVRQLLHPGRTRASASLKQILLEQRGRLVAGIRGARALRPR
jgi:hypothetical protein